MKLVFITEFFPDNNHSHFSGGVESRTYQLVSYLRKKHAVVVLNRSKKKVAPTLGSVASRLQFMISSLFKASKEKADIIEGSNYICLIPAFFAARLSGAKAVAWYADVYDRSWFEHLSLPVASLGFILEKIGLSLRWDHVIAMSQTTKDKLIARGIPSESISIVYGGVDIDLLTSFPGDSKFNKPTIITTARLVSYKRIQDLIHSFKLVKQTISEAQLQIVGDGPERKKLEELVVQLSLTESVTFTGALSHEEVLRLMKKCHVFSLPSEVEGFGLVSIEAAACGLPYVSTNIPATREITHKGSGGYLYPPGDYKQSARHMIKLLSNPSLFASKKDAAVRMAQEYDLKRIHAQTEHVYRLLIEP